MAESKKPKRSRLLSRLLEMDVADIASLPALYRHTTHLLRFSFRVVENFIHDRCIQRASALAYASLLAIVPIVVIGFTIFTSFEAFDAMAVTVINSLLEHILPTSQQAVQEYLSAITDKTTTISTLGVIALLLTATALLNTIEEAFNDIWRTTHTRTWLTKFITFWAILTLTPILIGASITITSYFTALPVIREVTEGASYIAEVPFIIPWLMSSLAMATMYSVLPNRTVPFRYAIVGGLVAGALFEWSKIGFAFYITDIANYERLYGALSTLPAFLIWIYLVWVWVLIGSEVAFCLQHPESSRKQQSGFQQSGVRQFYSHLILLRATEALQQGGALKLDDLVEEVGIHDDLIQEWIDQLCVAKLLRHTKVDDATPAWIPGLNAEKMTLYEIFHRLNKAPMTVPEEWQESTLGRQLKGIYFRMDREQSDLLKSITIKDIMDRDQERAIATETVLNEATGE